MTLNSLLERLDAASPEAALVFRTDQGDIGGGYHVTEFKHSTITSIDCGARVSEWSEASMQLLDGSGQEHMAVGKFASLLRQSLNQIDGLGEASVRVEFAPGNDGLRIYEMGDPEIRGDEVFLRMNEAHVLCKPMVDLAKTSTSKGCCGSGKPC